MESLDGTDVDAAVPDRVRELVDRHLGELDRAAPGLVERLYLSGSVALGDYHPGVSDIDFLAVMSRPLGPDELAAVAAVHRGMPSSPHYDGVYLDRASVEAMVDDGRAAPHVVDGVFRGDEPCGELNPVLWLTLDRRGVAVRGPATANLDLRVDPDRLRRWNLDNLKEYWQPLAWQVRQAVAERADDAVAHPVGVVWAVLGPGRLHYTLATGQVASKSEAGVYTAGRFPEWAELIERSLAWRRGHEDVSFVTTDAVAAAALIDAVVEDAWLRWG
ncbi:nucleotidyltransferase domain-containing protein [Rugosimonospora acidiphila]